MKTRYVAPVLAAAMAALLGSGCNTVKAQAAFKDGNKLYQEENYRKAIELYERSEQAVGVAVSYRALGDLMPRIHALSLRTSAA